MKYLNRCRNRSNRSSKTKSKSRRMKKRVKRSSKTKSKFKRMKKRVKHLDINSAYICILYLLYTDALINLFYILSIELFPTIDLFVISFSIGIWIIFCWS